VSKRAKVTILGAGNVGSALARQIVEKNLAQVVVWNRSTKAQGLALDLLQSGSQSILGTNNYRDTANSDVVVITTGMPRQPGMNRDELAQINAKIVTEVTQQAIAYSPEAILIVVTNPLDAITYIAWQASRLPPHRVMGMGGMLDSARLKTFIALELGLSIADIQTMVIGSHGDLMVPLPRYCSVRGIPLTELMKNEKIDRLIERTRRSGAEIVELMQTKSAYLAPAKAIYEMLETILLDRPRILPISTYLDGNYGVGEICIGVPCRLSGRGIESIVELKLNNKELELLHQSARSIRQNLIRTNSQLLSSISA
jgi:malate dehydrogenase